MSFFEKIMKISRYVPQTTNCSESGNEKLNQLIFTLSKSRKLYTIARSLRTFMITDYQRKKRLIIKLIKKLDDRRSRIFNGYAQKF